MHVNYSNSGKYFIFIIFPKGHIYVVKRQTIRGSAAPGTGFAHGYGETSEYRHERHLGNHSDIFHQCRIGADGPAPGSGHQRSHGIDIWNLRISGASGPLWNRALQNFVGFLQNSIFSDMPLAIGRETSYNADTISNQTFQISSKVQMIPEAYSASVTRCDDRKEGDGVFGDAMCIFDGGLWL